MNTRGFNITRRKDTVCLLRRVSGFTLIELMVVIVVTAVGLVLAIPSMTNIINSNRLTSTANELVAAITQARMQAIKRNIMVQFCSDTAANNNSDTLGSNCGTDLGAVWWVDSTSQIQMLQPVTLPSSVTVIGTTALRFSGNGLATTAIGTSIYSGLIADVYASSLSTRNHRCLYLVTGSNVSVCTVSGNSGACPANETITCEH